MAPVNPPSYLEAGQYSARLDRITLGALLTPRSTTAVSPRPGVLPGRNTSEELAVHQRATPDMWVTVDPGQCVVQAAASGGGAYFCTNDAGYDVQLAAAHASLPRKDLIVARLWDAIDDTGSANEWTLEPVTGTAAASPAAPTVPSNALNLYEVTVAANATAITNANLTDRRIRTVARGGVLPVTSTMLPTSPYPGMVVYAIDTDTVMIWSGTAWRRFLTESYNASYGTLANLAFDPNPNQAITTTSESNAGARVTTAQFSFTMPPGVPSTRRIYVNYQLNVAVSPNDAWFSFWLDGASWSFGRRFGATTGQRAKRESGHEILAPPAAGSHTVDLRIWNEASSSSTEIYSGELAIVLL